MKHKKIEKNILLFILSTTLIFACERKGFTVEGDFENSPEKIVILDEVLPDQTVPIDTILLINGSFTHFVPRTEKGFYRLRFSDTSTVIFIAEKNDELLIKGDLNDIKHTQQITGNEESEMFLEVNRAIFEMYKITDSLAKVFNKHKGEEDFLRICKDLDSCYYYHFNKNKAYLSDFIENNLDKFASISAIYQMVGQRPFFTVREDSALYRKLVDGLSKKYPQNQHVLMLKERLPDE